jgi:hypothetical protein
MAFRRRRNHQHCQCEVNVGKQVNSFRATGHVAPTNQQPTTLPTDPCHLSVDLSYQELRTPHATSMTAPTPAHRASTATSTSALSSEQSSCPRARTSASRCAWPLARFASTNATWSATSAFPGDSNGRAHVPPPISHPVLPFTPTIVNLVLVWRLVRSSLSLHGRRNWNLDGVWVGVGWKFTSHEPAFGVWPTATSVNCH